MSMVPVVASASELPAAISYAQSHSESRWYVARRAHTLGQPELIPAEWGEALVAATAGADLSTGQLAALGKKGQALKNSDGSFSYPTRNRAELARAFQAFGRARNKVAAKRYLLRRARGLHALDLVPDSWKPLRASADSQGEAELWVSQVRNLITDAGFDPAEFEADTEGFITDYLEYQDDPQGYVQELIAAHEASDDDTEDEETDEPEAVAEADVPAEPVEAPAVTAPVPVAASGVTYTTTAGSNPYVLINTSPAVQAPPQFDMDALTAAIKAAAAEAATAAVTEALTAAKKKPLPGDVPVDDTTGEPLPPEDAALVPDDSVGPVAEDDPVDVESAKQSLRDKFGAHKPMKKTPVPKPVAASVTAMRERIAARNGG